MSVSPTSASTNPNTPLLNNNEQREENVSRRVEICYRLAKFGTWFSLLTLVTTSFCIRVIDCQDLSDKECKDKNKQLVPVEMLGVIAGSMLVFEKIVECVIECSIDNFCREVNELESNEPDTEEQVTV